MFANWRIFQYSVVFMTQEWMGGSLNYHGLSRPPPTPFLVIKHWAWRPIPLNTMNGVHGKKTQGYCACTVLQFLPCIEVPHWRASGDWFLAHTQHCTAGKRGLFLSRGNDSFTNSKGVLFFFLSFTQRCPKVSTIGSCKNGIYEPYLPFQILWLLSSWGV
jgi:hypothetical protein